MTTNTEPIEGVDTTAKKAKRPLQPFDRICDECGKGYTALTAKSKYCSGRCRKRAERKTLKGIGSDNKPDTIMNAPQSTELIEKPEKEKKFRALRPKFNNLPPDVSIGVMLLEKEVDRFERMYDEERAKRKKIQSKYEELKERTTQEKHAQALAGIEAAKPDIMERVMTGLAQLPPQILEGIGPAIGRLMNKVVPPEGVAGQLQGGDIDPMTKELLTWMASQPEQTRELLFGVIAILMGMEPDKLSSTLVQIMNVLKGGSTLSGPNNLSTIEPVLPYDKAMYNIQ